MLNLKNLQIVDYNYELPNDKIAIYPLSDRDTSKLLIYNRGHLIENSFRHINEYIASNSLLIFNNSKVIPARILFEQPSKNIIEIFILEPVSCDGGIQFEMQRTNSIECICLIGGARKWKEDYLIRKIDNIPFNIKASIISRNNENFNIKFEWFPSHFTFSEVLEMVGEIPLPPYLNRKAEILDKERYQTIYAKEGGSVAAPTAGLHFTDYVIKKLNEKDIDTEYITLHVGAGTFRPVKSETIGEHQMHTEIIDISVHTIEKLLNHDSIIAVGTTSLRAIESLYWMGVKAHLNPQITEAELEIKQWEIYEILNKQISKSMALLSLKNWMLLHKIDHLVTRTQILIVPGYTIKLCTGLVTNFHQPKSTLLLLIAALIKDDWKKVYNYALENNFRFLSYGDSSLIIW